MVTTMWDKISQFGSATRAACEKYEKALRGEWDDAMTDRAKTGRFNASRKHHAWLVVEQVLLENGPMRMSEIIDLASFRLTSRLSPSERSLVQDVLRHDLKMDTSAPSGVAPLSEKAPTPTREYSFAPSIYEPFFKMFEHPSVISKLALLRGDKAQAMQNLLDEVSIDCVILGHMRLNRLARCRQFIHHHLLVPCAATNG
jgi:hypothetical protein